MEGYIVGQTVPFEEDIGHEFKAGQRNPDGLILQMLPYISAYLNAQGGTLFFGIDDQRIVVGVAITGQQRDLARRKLMQQMRSFYPPVNDDQVTLSFKPVFNPDMSSTGRYVIEVKVEAGQETDLYSTPDGKIFVKRNGCRDEVKTLGDLWMVARQRLLRGQQEMQGIKDDMAKVLMGQFGTLSQAALQALSEDKIKERIELTKEHVGRLQKMIDNCTANIAQLHGETRRRREEQRQQAEYMAQLQEQKRLEERLDEMRRRSEQHRVYQELMLRKQQEQLQEEQQQQQLQRQQQQLQRQQKLQQQRQQEEQLRQLEQLLSQTIQSVAAEKEQEPVPRAAPIYRPGMAAAPSPPAAARPANQTATSTYAFVVPPPATAPMMAPATIPSIPMLSMASLLPTEQQKLSLPLPQQPQDGGCSRAAPKSPIGPTSFPQAASSPSAAGKPASSAIPKGAQSPTKHVVVIKPKSLPASPDKKVNMPPGMENTTGALGALLRRASSSGSGMDLQPGAAQKKVHVVHLGKQPLRKAPAEQQPVAALAIGLGGLGMNGGKMKAGFAGAGQNRVGVAQDDEIGDDDEETGWEDQEAEAIDEEDIEEEDYDDEDDRVGGLFD